MSRRGTRFTDFDNDGCKDLFVATGHVIGHIEECIRMVCSAQSLLTFKNERGRFEEVSDRMGPAFRQPWIARGAAFGDFDNNGETNIFVQVLGGPPLLLENLVGSRNHLVCLELVGTRNNRDAIGAQIKVVDTDGGEQYFFVSVPPATFPPVIREYLADLGDKNIASVKVDWPSGLHQQIRDVPAGRYVRIRERSAAL